MKRLDALDYYKFIAMFMMLFGHSLVWLLSDNDMTINSNSWQWIIKEVFPIIGIIPNSLPFAINISIRFILSKNWKDLKEIDLIHFFRRSVIFMLIGFLMNFLTWGIDDLFT